MVTARAHRYAYRRPGSGWVPAWSASA